LAAPGPVLRGPTLEGHISNAGRFFKKKHHAIYTRFPGNLGTFSLHKKAAVPFPDIEGRGTASPAAPGARLKLTGFPLCRGKAFGLRRPLYRNVWRRYLGRAIGFQEGPPTENARMFMLITRECANIPPNVPETFTNASEKL
jgi:hypothetical protein